MNGGDLEPRGEVILWNPHHLVSRQDIQVGEILVLEEGTKLHPADDGPFLYTGGNDHGGWIL